MVKRFVPESTLAYVFKDHPRTTTSPTNFEGPRPSGESGLVSPATGNHRDPPEVEAVGGDGQYGLPAQHN